MLTQSHLDSLAYDGYTIVSGLVPEPLVRSARDVICSAVHADLARPDTWYRNEPLEWSVVPVHQAQAFWDIRQWPAVYEAFARLWGSEKLWVSMDRAIFKVPQSTARPDHVDGSVPHWDVDPRPASGYQGMLYLTDAGPGEGTFECAPSLFRNIEHYLATHEGPLLDVPIDVPGQELIELTLRAGDLVIWSSRLPHHGGPNRGSRPRVSMSLAMHPVGGEAERLGRLECWAQKRAPRWWRGWKGQLDPEPGESATLTELGRRLVGIARWP